MNKSEQLLQKNLNLLPGNISKHKTVWEQQLKEIPTLLRILTYQSEEFLHIKSVQRLNTDVENFEELKDELSIILTDEINDTLEKLLDRINHLKKVNNDMKNRIDALEKLSSESYNNLSLKFISGNERQPNLGLLLQCCTRYRTFFLENLETIFTSFNSIDLKRTESVKDFKQCFNIDLSNRDVTFLISLIQYLN